MTTMRPFVIAVGLLASAPQLARAQAHSTYDAVVSGRTCSKSDLVPNNGELSCYYSVGQGLSFAIGDIGSDDATIVVLKATELNAEYRFEYDLRHACVIVKPALAAVKAAIRAHQAVDLAYVSPRNGGVYMSVEDCQAGSGSKPSNDR